MSIKIKLINIYKNIKNKAFQKEDNSFKMEFKLENSNKVYTFNGRCFKTYDKDYRDKII